MDRWIARLNVARYRRRLAGALDDVERRAVEKLLAEEEAKLKALDRPDRTK